MDYPDTISESPQSPHSAVWQNQQGRILVELMSLGNLVKVLKVLDMNYLEFFSEGFEEMSGNNSPSDQTASVVVSK